MSKSILVGLSISLLLVCAARTDAQRHRDPCQLLSDTEVRLVQGHALAQKIASEQPSASFRFTQCYYRTDDFTSSVSVAVGVPVTTDSTGSGPRQYWQAQFKKQEKVVPGRKKKEPPKPIEGLGDEAFWVGDPMSGALYVLKGEVFLRVSAGGARDQAEKIKRAKLLAAHALKRLDIGRSNDRKSPNTR